MDERYYDEGVSDKELEADDLARERDLWECTGPLPDDEPEHDEDVAGAIAEVRRAA